ncbi:MAG: TonB C-terminal domain-containing protein [Proteobacteria bacterium]|nr:TonB C-terminal domain-containing protein [Pseudomonadota bacterium]
MRRRKHKQSAGETFLGIFATVVIHAAIFAVFALSSGGEAEGVVSVQTDNSIFCRYIENGRMFQIEVPAVDWQDAEETVCGVSVRDVRLGPLLLEGARLILDNSPNRVVYAQRESCSCSDDKNLPILQDLSLVEAPRLGAETKKTALPRIFNAPEESQQNTVTTRKDMPEKRPEKKPEKKPSIEDLLSAAADFDEARPVSDVDPGGSLDGSRLSKSATGKGDPYLQKLKAKLDNSMNAPATIPKTELKKLEAIVIMKVGDNGVLWSWNFSRKSGNSAFDNMIKKCLEQFTLNGQMRFANPPETWRMKDIQFTVSGKDISG